LLDARFHLLAVGPSLYQGVSPKPSLDLTARRILLPQMRLACIDRTPRTEVLEDFGRRWVIRVQPILGAVSGQPVAVLGCYGPAHAKLPDPPLVGSWEWRVTPPGPDQQMRIHWSKETFDVYGIPAPPGAGPYYWEAPQWLDEIVADAHRTEVQRVLERFLTMTSDALLIHNFAARTADGGQVRLRLAGRRDVTAPGPDTWLRGVTMRLDPAAAAVADTSDSPSYLDAAFALARDPLCAIDTLYEHVYLTSARFAELGVALPAHRHLPEMCHPEDLPALRTMLKQATADAGVPAGPVRVRLAAAAGQGWREVDVTGSGIRLSGEPPHHVLCLVTAAPRTVETREQGTDVTARDHPVG
jgi:hypothetical protein